MRTRPANGLPTGHRDVWLRLDDVALLAQCRQERYRAGGPGGQRRNKVETAIRLHHQPTGITAAAEDSRSLEENRRRALRRLRERLALSVREPFDPAAPDLPTEFLAHRGPGGALAVNPRNRDYVLVVAIVLDALAAAGGSYARAAATLDVTTSQLLGLLKGDRGLWRALSEKPRQGLSGGDTA